LVRFWYRGHSTLVNIVNALLQFPLLIITISGIWWAKKRKFLISPILLIVIYFWITYGAIHAISRYSFPVVALLCPFVAIGIINLMHTTLKVKSDLFALPSRSDIK